MFSNFFVRYRLQAKNGLNEQKMHFKAKINTTTSTMTSPKPHDLRADEAVCAQVPDLLPTVELCRRC